MKTREYRATAGALIVLGVGVVAGCSGSNGTDAGRSPVVVTVTASTSASGSPSGSVSEPTIPMGNKGTPRGGCGLKTVDEHDSSAVALMVSKVTACWDTALDKAPADGQRRAIPLLTDRLGNVLSQPLGGNGGGSASGWKQLVAHHGWMQVTVQIADEDGGTPDTATHATHEVMVTATGHAKSWTGTKQQTLHVVHMTRTTKTDPWRVSQIEPVQ